MAQAQLEQRTYWHTLSTDAAAAQLKTDYANGLTESEVQQRLEQYGLNELVEKGRRSSLDIIWDQLTNPLVLLLIAAAVVSGFLGKWDGTIAISTIVVLNAILGYTQENRAEQAMAALKKMSAPSVRVRRGGRVMDVKSNELVPGDVIMVEAGSIIPADALVTEAANLRVLEASLTGESVAVEKTPTVFDDPNMPLGDRDNMLYMGTSVTYGRGSAVIVETGMRTELGRIAELIQGVEQDKTPLQRRMDELGTAFVVLALVIIAISFGLGFLRPDPNLSDLFVAAVAIAVAVVPEGLPAIVTITLALGARRMLDRQALIRKLPAVETLGSVTVICSDKTGTLTENKMTVKVLDVAGQQLDVIEYVRSGHAVLNDEQRALVCDNPAQVLLLIGGGLCNDAVLQESASNLHELVAIGDPTEGALVIAAARYGFMKNDLDGTYSRVGEVPFDADRKRMTTIHALEGTSMLSETVPTEGKPYVIFTKGSVDGLLDISNRVWINGEIVLLDEALHARITETNNGLAKNGLRVLGVGFRMADTPDDDDIHQVERDLVFLGMIGIIDPPRVEVKDSVAIAKMAGIRPVMITGDHPLTAQYIARDLGIARNDQVVTGRELAEMDDDALLAIVSEVDVYARVSPEHKLKIVDALQRRGQVAAMTGDGVNDAPALRKADIGVAMGITGTAVSREASDMVLLDDNFATIVAAVEEGRTIYDNVLKFIKYIMGSNTGEVFVLLVTQALGLPLPLTTLQILYMNLVTDGLPAIALALEPAENNTMRRPPQKPKESIFARGMWQHLTYVGALIFATTITLAYIAWDYVQAGVIDFATWSTMIFTTLVLVQMGHALSVRSDTETIPKKGLFTNMPLFWAVIATIGLQLVLIYVPFFQNLFGTAPLTLEQLGICAGIVVFVTIMLELRKLVLPKWGMKE